MCSVCCSTHRSVQIKLKAKHETMPTAGREAREAVAIHQDKRKIAAQTRRERLEHSQLCTA